MLRLLIAILLAGVLLCIAAAAPSSALAGGADAESRRITAEVFNALRHGGYVLVVAHGPQDRDEDDLLGASPDDCRAQPVLTDTGRLMASGIGKLLGREHVKVGAVLSSRTCRGAETAERIARHTNAPRVRRLDELSETTSHLTPAEKARRVSALRRLGAEAPPAGSNTIIVTHRANITEAFGAGRDPVRDGDLLVVQAVREADGRMSCRVVQRLSIDDLSAYTRVVKP